MISINGSSNPVATQQHNGSLDTAIALSFFRNKRDNIPAHESVPLARLAEFAMNPTVRAQKDGLLISPACFSPAKRSNENVTELSALMLDYDGTATWGEEIERWSVADCLFIAYSTHSHQRGTPDHPEPADRFRILLPLFRPIPAPLYSALWRWAWEWTEGRIDPTPKALAQMFYAPVKASSDAPYLYHVADSKTPLDWTTLRLPAVWKQRDSDQPVIITGTAGSYDGELHLNIDGSATGMPVSQLVAAPAKGTPSDEAAAQAEAKAQNEFENTASQPAARSNDERRKNAYVRKAIEEEVSRVRSATQPGRNATLNKAAFALGQLLHLGTVSRNEAEAELESTAVACGLGTDREGGGIRGVRATIKSGLEDGEKQPRELPAPTIQTKAVATKGGGKAKAKADKADASSAQQPAGDDKPDSQDGYQAVDGSLVLVKNSGAERMPLANFVARIVSDVVRDDGSETSRVFEIAATLNGQVIHGEVSADKFSAMGWPVDMLGAKAIIYPNRKDHARTAIQMISDDIKTRRVYAHTGWRELDGAWCFLHGGGAIGSGGQMDADVKLSSTLAPFNLPAPLQGDELRAAIRAELELLDIAPDAITVPAIGSVWAALTGEPDFSTFFEGNTGWGKTQLAIILQQHFGQDFNERRLPGNWMTTANANAEIAYEMKDAVMIVDDFKPAGTTQDVARLHKDADRLLRGQGNRAGRGRLRSDSTLRSGRPPRGLIVGTGEDIPKGESLRARMLVLRYEKDTTNWPRLTQCQYDARQGLYAQCTAAFIQWLAPRYAEMRRTCADSISAQREIWTAHLPGHKRTPTTAAYLTFAWQPWLAMASAHGAITKDEFETLWRRIRKAIKDVCLAQASYQVSEDPARRFIEVIQGALMAGKGHVALLDGTRPDNYESWGWRGGDAQGERIGWLDNGALYLNPDVAHNVATKTGGADVTITPTTLWKRLRQAGYLLTEDGQDSNLVRKMIDGRRMRVLAIAATKLEAEEDASSAAGADSEA